VGLIVDQLPLLFATLDIGKLTAAKCISHCNFALSEQSVSGPKDDHHTRHHHNLVNGSWVASDLKITFTIDIYKSLEERISRHTVVVKS
jgi:hypothetical protein